MPKQVLSRRRFLVGSGPSAVVTLAGLTKTLAGAVPRVRRSTSEVVKLRDLLVTLGRPQVVAQSPPPLSEHRAESLPAWPNLKLGGYCWYPDLLNFSSGELMLTYSLNADSSHLLHRAQAVLISRNKGRTWDFAYDVEGFHQANGEVRLSLSDGSLAGPSSSNLRPDPPGQGRRFRAHYWRYEEGGRRYSVEPWSVLIEGFPRDAVLYTGSRGEPRTASHFAGEAVEIEKGRFIATFKNFGQGDRRWHTLVFVSEDEGRTWHYLSTVCGPDAVPDSREGPNESSMIQLGDGDLMAVLRVGQKLARTYSSDGGKTWAPLDRLDAWSVAPCMVRLRNGTIALSTGRPGLYLWLSTDSRGKQWESIDLVKYHNSAVETPHHIRIFYEETKEGRILHAHKETTGYTAMVEVSPNRILLAYDRCPFGAEPVPRDSQNRSQIYLLEIEVQRK